VPEVGQRPAIIAHSRPSQAILKFSTIAIIGHRRTRRVKIQEKWKLFRGWWHSGGMVINN
jgi:hypothetical protein